MTISYKPLWKILIDRDLTKEQFRKAVGLSPTTIAKMGRGEHISMDVIERICRYLGVQPGDIMTWEVEVE